MLQCIDQFHSELQIKPRAIMEVAVIFEDVYVKSFISATKEELKISIPKLITFHDEVSESELLIHIQGWEGDWKQQKLIRKKKVNHWAIFTCSDTHSWMGLPRIFPNLSTKPNNFSDNLCVCSKLKLIKKLTVIYHGIVKAFQSRNIFSW